MHLERLSGEADKSLPATYGSGQESMNKSSFPIAEKGQSQLEFRCRLTVSCGRLQKYRFCGWKLWKGFSFG